ncbi:hypothetical protein CAK95_14345 [Pseudorhodoplanes sinuspersici]|uniref:Uncharacterized protein n=1 Tax=Pseudorhodoplanes sinuspersici TaxID=1235591 RepID=A0A1W6ZRX8_9HYPH|nr:hypothetical protein CAK95_14345 [Pseudorhodoplanes sinuspersici]
MEVGSPVSPGSSRSGAILTSTHNNNKNPNEKQPDENPEGTFHFNPGNMAGKKPGDAEKSAKNRGEPHNKEESAD